MKDSKIKKTILIIEDENIARMYLKTIISKDFENVFTASNGKDGYELYLKIKPDLIISDLEMPVMDGISMISKIREKDANIPIIVTTAYSDDEHIVENIQSKIFKPIIIDEMLSTIKSLLKIN
jgi:YesN/AraC family two-component response regulator